MCLAVCVISLFITSFTQNTGSAEIGVDDDGNVVISPAQNGSILASGTNLTRFLAEVAGSFLSLQSSIATQQASLNSLTSTLAMMSALNEGLQANFSSSQSTISAQQLSINNLTSAIAQLSTTNAGLQINVSSSQSTMTSSINSLTSTQSVQFTTPSAQQSTTTSTITAVNSTTAVQLSSIKQTSSSSSLPPDTFQVINDSLFIKARNQVYLVSQPTTYQITQGASAWNPTSLTVNVGDVLNFTWPASSLDYVSWVMSDLTTVLQDSGAPSKGGSAQFTVSSDGVLFYRSASKGWIVQVLALGTGAERNGFIQTAKTGVIQPFAGTKIPAGWLLCDGSQLTISSYRTLFLALGTTCGGDGITTFNLPDLRGRTVIGTQSGKYGLGQAVGAEMHTLTVDQMPSHGHGATDNGHTHTGTTAATFVGNHGATSGGNAGACGSNNYYYDAANYCPYGSSHSHYFTTDSGKANINIQSSGGGAPHNNMQPSTALNYITKT